MGLEAFLDEQLHPERTNDGDMEARLIDLPTLTMTTEELVESYPPVKRQIRREERSLTEKAGSTTAMSEGWTARTNLPDGAQPSGEGTGQGPQEILTELAREEVLRAVYSKRQLLEVMVQFWMNHFNIFAPKGADKWLMTSFERDVIRPHALGKFEDLLVATAESPAMLFYLDNWMSSATAFESIRRPAAPARGAKWPLPRGRQIIRRWTFFGGDSQARPANFLIPSAQRPNRGLNENYSRELMELHTLGVDGGYTQRDVIEVARCLTGWTINRPRQGGGFIFRPARHDYGPKIVLGHRIPPGRGLEDGLEVLHILATHPATAHFIARKLCQRFVADDPPQTLVDRAAQTFTRSGGDIRVVLKTILTSPEFYSEAAYRAKTKSPLELVASTMRALGAETDAGPCLLQLIGRMGQPMFQYQAPAGFPDRASTWINSGSLLARMNFATLVAANRVPGTRVNWEHVAPGVSSRPEAVIASLDRQLLHGGLSEQTRRALLNQAAMGPPLEAAAGQPLLGRRTRLLPAGEPSAAAGQVSTLAALLIASPEFQRR